MKIIALVDAPPALSLLLAEIQREQEIILTDHAQPVARLTRIAPQVERKEWDQEMAALFVKMRAAQTGESTEEEIIQEITAHRLGS